MQEDCRRGDSRDGNVRSVMEGGGWLVGGCFIGDVIDLVSERLEFLF